MNFYKWLFEQSYSGGFYLNLDIPLEEFIKKYKNHSNAIIWDYEGKNSEYVYFVQIRTDSWTLYKKGLGSRTASSNEYNYIYELKNLNLLTYYDKNEFNWAIKNKFIKFKNKDGFEVINKDLFFTKYDGIRNNKTEAFILIDDLLKKATLVDGNVIRLEKSNNLNNDFNFPEWIKTELIRYTDSANSKMKKDVKEWLKENSPKAKTKKIYRGFGIYDDNDKIEKLLYKMTGFRKLEDIKLYSQIEIKRGKESSWSTSPIIAREFAKGMSEGRINFLVEYIAKDNEIIIDFTELTEEQKSDFIYRNQNEIILDTGKYKAKIIGLWCDSYFIKWLNDNGYSFNPKIGITS